MRTVVLASVLSMLFVGQACAQGGNCQSGGRARATTGTPDVATNITTTMTSPLMQQALIQERAYRRQMEQAYALQQQSLQREYFQQQQERIDRQAEARQRKIAARAERREADEAKKAAAKARLAARRASDKLAVDD